MASKKSMKAAQEKVDRLLKLECRLGHIEYSDNPNSVYQSTEKERATLQNEIVSLVANGMRP